VLLLGLSLIGCAAVAQQVGSATKPHRQAAATPSPFAEAEALLRQGSIAEAKETIAAKKITPARAKRFSTR
jgi:hypothetical protein